MKAEILLFFIIAILSKIVFQAIADIGIKQKTILTNVGIKTQFRFYFLKIDKALFFMNNFKFLNSSVMKKIVYIIVLVFTHLFSFSQTINTNWISTGGGLYDDGSKAICFDKNQNLLLTGYYKNAAIFDTISINGYNQYSFDKDIFILRYNSLGELNWVKSITSMFDCEGTEIAVSQSNSIYVSGTYRRNMTIGNQLLEPYSMSGEDIFLTKVDDFGQPIWARRAGGGGYDKCEGMAIDNNSSIFLTGYYNSTSNFDTISFLNYYGAIYIAKFDSTGIVDWAKSITTNWWDVSFDIETDMAGNSYVIAEFTSSVTVNGVSYASSGEEDILLIKLNNAGNFIWSKKAGGSNIDIPRDIFVDDAGTIYITGYFQGTATFGNQSITSNGGYDIFVACCSSVGQWQWVVSAGGTGDDQAFGISMNELGGIYITGRFENTINFTGQSKTSNGGTDIFLAKYDLFGGFLWAEAFGGTTDDGANSIDVSETGTIALTGYFQNSMTIDTITVSSNGGNDIFVASFEDNNINYCGVPNSYFNTSINYTEISIEPFYPYDTSLYFLSWQMGDGTEFYQMTSVQYDYQAVDTFNIILTVQDKNDSLCFINLYDTVVTACYLDVLQISSQINGTNVELETSYFIDTSFWSISWDLGDGAQFFQTNSLQYNYQQIDTFVISLFIEDNNGSICSINLHDTIITTCLIDDLDFSMQRDSTNVSFETSYFLDTTEYQIIWDFGDSTSISNQNNPTNFYNYYGYKTITLSVVYLPDGTCNNQIQKTLNVDSIPCIQSAEIVIYENVYKHAIFELLPNVDTVNYNILWNLGDGITIENQYLINHIFPYTNIYDVTCQLSHKADSNCILIIEKEIDLECYNDIGFDYEIDYDTWQYGWNALVWAYEVYNEPPNSYALNCNCGTGGTGYTMNNHWHWNCLYTNVGNYPISLTVYDLEDSTCFGSYGPINITIEEPECDVYAAIGNVFLFEYDSMTVIVQGGGNPDFSYNWTFGDGTSGGGYEEWHTYSDYGVYEICLTAINNLGVGCSETDCEYFTLGTPGCNDTLALNYNPNADFNNGSCIYSGTQSISLPQGWSIFSTYIEPYENNIDSVFQEIVGNTVLVKNQIGLVYYPQYSITLLDTLALGQGYQVKMSSGDTLSVTGIICQPQNSPITLQAGWSIIGYLRQIPADISQMFSDITQNTEIVKDELGNVYWPQYSVNNIGNMLPGKGYQVKMNVGDVLNY